MAKATKSAVKAKKALTRTAVIPADEVDAKLYEDARNAVNRAKLLGNTDESAAVEERLREVTEKVLERGLEFTFRGIGRVRYEELLREHSPTDAQKAQAEQNNRVVQGNVDTFPAALCAAAAVDSELSEKEWLVDIFESEDWNPSELGALFDAALGANSDSKVVMLGN